MVTVNSDHRQVFLQWQWRWKWHWQMAMVMAIANECHFLAAANKKLQAQQRRFKYFLLKWMTWFKFFSFFVQGESLLLNFFMLGKDMFLNLLACRARTCRGTRWTATTWPPFSPQTSSTRWSPAMGRYHRVITKHGQITPNIIKHCQLYLKKYLKLKAFWISKWKIPST